MPIFNYQKLKGRIVERVETQGNFADLMNWSRPTLSRKLTGESEWTQCEILKACEILAIDIAEMHIYFFNTNVQD